MTITEQLKIKIIEYKHQILILASIIQELENIIHNDSVKEELPY